MRDEDVHLDARIARELGVSREKAQRIIDKLERLGRIHRGIATDKDGRLYEAWLPGPKEPV